MERTNKLLDNPAFVELWAKKLKEDSSLFKVHKEFIESQMRINSLLLRSVFGEGEEYKKNVREFLRKFGAIKPLES